MSNEQPLTDLYMDRHSVDQERLRDALQGIIGIDEDSGEPIYLDAYFELSNKTRFVAQLLYREATVILGDRDPEEQGDSSSAFAASLDSSGSAVQNYASDLDFVETDEERGGYVIRPHHAPAAIEFLNEQRSDGEN